MLRALNYMKNIGVVHKDIKPENIMIENDDKELIKIIDFGYSHDIQKELS